MLALAAAALLVATPLTSPPSGDGRRLLLDCEKSFLALASMRGTAKTRTIAYPLGELTPLVEDSVSDFWYRRSDDVRYENARPVPNTVVWNGKTLWIWSPTENAFVEEPASEAPLTTRTLLNVHPGFGLDPLAPIPIDDYDVRLQPLEESTIPKDGAVAGDVVVTLTPKENATLRATMQIVVVPAKRFVRRVVSRAAERGAVIADVRFSDEVEARSGTWFARRVLTKELLPDGSTVESTKVYERLRYDVEIEDAKFTMTLPKDAMRVRVTDVRAGSGGR